VESVYILNKESTVRTKVGYLDVKKEILGKNIV
jgi:hypothetical protein